MNADQWIAALGLLLCLGFALWGALSPQRKQALRRSVKSKGLSKGQMTLWRWRAAGLWRGLQRLRTKAPIDPKAQAHDLIARAQQTSLNKHRPTSPNKPSARGDSGSGPT